MNRVHVRRDRVACLKDVWTDAAAKFGIPPPPPFLSLSMADDDFLAGVNFASGGAGILNETGVYFVSHIIANYSPRH